MDYWYFSVEGESNVIFLVDGNLTKKNVIKWKNKPLRQKCYHIIKILDYGYFYQKKGRGRGMCVDEDGGESN